MKFTKLHGCGNDYLYIDCIGAPPPGDPAALARAMSDRHFGVGSDGLILALPSTVGDVRMRMFNADGSEGAMCGNGIRGLAKFVFDRRVVRANPMRVETLRGMLRIKLHLDLTGKVAAATVDMDEPFLELSNIGVDTAAVQPVGAHLHRFDDRFPPAVLVSMGSDHAVLFTDNLAAVELALLGPRVERHPAFPRRINAHWAAVQSRDEVTMRTWERGSGTTLACGTGACAVVVAGVLTGRLDQRVTVHLPGGDLDVEWRQSNNHVYMTGPAVEVFEGEWKQNEPRV